MLHSHIGWVDNFRSSCWDLILHSHISWIDNFRSSRLTLNLSLLDPKLLVSQPAGSKIVDPADQILAYRWLSATFLIQSTNPFSCVPKVSFSRKFQTSCSLISLISCSWLSGTSLDDGLFDVLPTFTLVSFLPTVSESKEHLLSHKSQSDTSKNSIPKAHTGHLQNCFRHMSGTYP